MSLKIEKDYKGLKDLKRNIRELAYKDIEWGFFPEDRYGNDNDNLHVAEVATYNEFGTDFNLERPFFRTSIREVEKNIFKLLAPVFTDLLLNKNPTRSLETLGEHLKKSVQDSIESWTTPPNSFVWSSFKASVGAPTKPLEFTDKMLDSVKYKICRKRK